MFDNLLPLGGLFTSAFISSTLLPGASEAVLAYMVADGQFTPLLLIAVASVANTLGALTTWWLGSLAAKKYPVEAVLNKAKQASVNWVRRYGYWSLLFSWLPLVGDGLCFAGGWLRMAFVPGCVAIFVGKAVRYTVIALLFVP